MSSWPRVIIDPEKLVYNYQVLKQRADRARINLTAVLKGIAGDLRVTQALVEAGLTEIGDSRLENLTRIKKYPQVRRVMLRVPSLSRCTETIDVADCSLNSEPLVLQALNDAVPPNAKAHEVYLMVDLGDLREGVAPEQLNELAIACKRLTRLRVTGLGANFSCFAGLKPTLPKLEQLTLIAANLRAEYGLPFDYVSGGNSSSLLHLYSGTIPPGINHLRIGEGILLGRETLTGSQLPDLHHDAFVLEAEVIQARKKPGCPEGEVGFDAFGRIPDLQLGEAGPRFLLNIGHQDTPLSGLKPLDPELQVLGGSSDYLVMAGKRMLRVGQVIQFIPNYWSLLGLMTSPYVKKSYRDKLTEI